MKDLSKFYPKLYGKRYDEKALNERFETLVKTHIELFKVSEADVAIFSTSGRSELAGNHTDHNLGKVIAASINLDTIAAVSKRNDNICVLKSEGFDVVEVDISKLDVIESEKNSTNALLRGIAASFKQRGLNVGGFNANTTTNVLKGSGLSSSAAIEVLIATIFNNFFNSDTLPPLELAKIGQEAENNYFGKPSGLMDQIGCACGGIVGIDFKDNKNPILSEVDINFEEYGYSLVVIDTKGNHANLTNEYAAVPLEMKEVAHYFNKEYLREVDYSAFLENLPLLRAKINNDRAILRAFHYFNENQRVTLMLDALKHGDITSFLKSVEESGNSSYKYLQNIYASFNTSEQSIALALAICESTFKEFVVSRVHGGGFAGTIQAYVKEEKLDQFIKVVSSIFGSDAINLLAIRSLPTCRLI